MNEVFIITAICCIPFLTILLFIFDDFTTDKSNWKSFFKWLFRSFIAPSIKETIKKKEEKDARTNK